jgi:hypothetical protein
LLLLTNHLFAQSNTPDWVEETKHTKWQARVSQAEVVFKDQLWIFVGWFNSYDAPPRDVWSSKDGKEWNLVLESAPWIHSDLSMALLFKNKMWMMGGWYNGRLDRKNRELATGDAGGSPPGLSPSSCFKRENLCFWRRKLCSGIPGGK